MADGFPAAPPPPEGFGGIGGFGGTADQTERGPAPSTVVNAVRLMIARCVLSVVGVAVSFSDRDELRRRLLRRNPSLSDSAINTALTIGVGIAVAVLVFYLFLAFRVRHGANWARIVVWVIGGLALLGALTQFAQPYPPATRTVSLLALAVDLGTVVLLALPASNAYFRRR